MRSLGASGGQVAQVFWVEGTTLSLLAWLPACVAGVPSSRTQTRKGSSMYLTSAGHCGLPRRRMVAGVIAAPDGGLGAQRRGRLASTLWQMDGLEGQPGEAASRPSRLGRIRGLRWRLTISYALVTLIAALTMSTATAVAHVVHGVVSADQAGAAPVPGDKQPYGALVAIFDGAVPTPPGRHPLATFIVLWQAGWSPTWLPLIGLSLLLGTVTGLALSHRLVRRVR